MQNCKNLTDFSLMRVHLSLSLLTQFYFICYLKEQLVKYKLCSIYFKKKWWKYKGEMYRIQKGTLSEIHADAESLCPREWLASPKGPWREWILGAGGILQLQLSMHRKINPSGSSWLCLLQLLDLLAKSLLEGSGVIWICSPGPDTHSYPRQTHFGAGRHDVPSSACSPSFDFTLPLVSLIPTVELQDPPKPTREIYQSHTGDQVTPCSNNTKLRQWEHSSQQIAPNSYRRNVVSDMPLTIHRYLGI